MTMKRMSPSFSLMPMALAFVMAAAVAAPAATQAHASQTKAAGSEGLSQARAVQLVSDEKTGQGAQKFIDGMAQRALDFLGNGGLSQTQKTSEFEKLLRDSFDMDTIGRFSLGRYWREATPAQQKEYLQLFRSMVVQVYSARFGDYTGQKFEVGNYRSGSNERDTIVTTFIVPDKGARVQVDWIVRHRDGKYRIVDVIVEGVSMSITQRSDFSSVIQRGGGNVQVLLDHLKRQNG